ncbi:MAG: hypothetical protein U1F00_18075 [Rhodoferax sp.]
MNWTYKVTNTGNTSFAYNDIAIVDDNGTVGNTADDMSVANGKITFLSVAVGNNDNVLDAGEVWLYQASGIVQNLGGTRCERHAGLLRQYRPRWHGWQHSHLHERRGVGQCQRVQP